jgi:hypothetical protein
MLERGMRLPLKASFPTLPRLQWAASRPPRRWYLAARPPYRRWYGKVRLFRPTQPVGHSGRFMARATGPQRCRTRVPVQGSRLLTMPGLPHRHRKPLCGNVDVALRRQTRDTLGQRERAGRGT